LIKFLEQKFMDFFLKPKGFGNSSPYYYQNSHNGSKGEEANNV